MQLPDPSLAKELGVVGYLLMVVVISGAATIAWFLRRMAHAMDKMATNQEPASALLAQISERMQHLGDKIDKSIDLAEENAKAARLWMASEWPGRTGREAKRDA